MEFNEKLQQLRKQKGLTQEELAEKLFVSRTAVSKWEQGRGYPSIDSLKAMAAFFDVTVDSLLSGEQILTIAQNDSRQKTEYMQDVVFGLLDCCVAVLFFIPFFGQKAAGAVQAVSLLQLDGTDPYLKAVYFAVTSVVALTGVFTLAFQNCRNAVWKNIRTMASLVLSGVAVLVFIAGQQSYAAALLFVFMMIKLFLYAKKQ